jgi:Protein of unknown function (DUF2946)
MQVLQRLRRASHITRFMLVWFALSLGVAIASPLVNPQSTELICSGAGVMKVLVKNADGSTSEAQASHGLECPLCAATAAPPPAAKTITLTTPPLGHAVQRVPAARLAALTAPPLPARGPPSFS